MIQFRIVVAKYKEDVSWTENLPCIIYNKDPNGPSPLPNIGREAHTYLYHIVSNYDTLDDYTIFVQGNPFDHSPNLLKNIQNITTASEVPDFMYLSEKILPCSSHYEVYYPSNEKPTIQQFHTFLFGQTPSRNFVFGAGAQFMVSKKLIQHIPKSVYEKLLVECCKDFTPWCIERFWQQIFTSGTGNVPPIIFS